MPDLAIRGRILREKFAGFDARSKKLAEDRYKLEDLYNNREELRKMGMVSSPSVDSQISELESKIREEAKKLWDDIHGVDLRNGGKGLFIDSVIKLCGSVPEDIYFDTAKTINKLYTEQKDFDGINRLIESDKRFEELFTRKAFRVNETDIYRGALIDILTNALYAKADGTENAVFKATFGTFYNTVEFCSKIWDDKDFLKTIYQDKRIPQQYKDQLKRAIQTYKYQIKNKRFSAADKAKLVAGGVASIPGLAIGLGGAIAGGTIKLGSELVGLVTGLAAFPTQLGAKTLYTIGQETDNKLGKAAAYTAGTILAIPTVAIKLAGGAVVGVLKLGGLITEKSLSLVSYPLVLPLKGALLSCVGTLPKTKQSEKIIRNNITKLIKETDPDAKLDDLKISCEYNYNERTLSVTGTTKDEEYKFEFDVGGKYAAANVEENINGGSYQIGSGKQEMLDTLSGEKDLKKVKDALDKQKALQNRNAAKVIADITSQRPSENKSEKNANIYVSLE